MISGTGAIFVRRYTICSEVCMWATIFFSVIEKPLVTRVLGGPESNETGSQGRYWVGMLNLCTIAVAITVRSSSNPTSE